LLALAVGGCAKTCDGEAPAGDAATSVTASASVAASATASAPVVRDAGATTYTAGDMTRYVAALKRGRASTVAKSYADALSAFSDALAVIPNDARATSERGYAKLLSGDTSGAKKDFTAALGEAPGDDKKLRAQIYFNLGLVDEKQGDADEAKTAFRASYEYNPTPQAKAKMAECPALITSLKTVPYATREAAIASLKKIADGTKPTDLACLGDDSACSAILPIASGVVEVYVGDMPSVDGRGSATISKDGANWVITLGSVACKQSCGCVNGDMNDCGNTYEECYRECAGAGGGVRCDAPKCTLSSPHGKLWVDATTGRGLWAVTWDPTFKDIQASVVGGSLHVSGAGCSVTRDPAAE
jgi:hypothetical protein